MKRDVLRSELQRLAFTPVPWRGEGPRIGAEVVRLAIDTATGPPSPIAPSETGDGPVASLDWLRPLAARAGWTDSRTAKGAPCFVLDGESTIGFEPGGQIEYSSAPHASASALIRRVRSVIAMLRAAADDAGVALAHVGIDPVNPIESVDLQLDAARYVRMDAYLASRGSAGRRMMRQTAATQVAVDLGPCDALAARWRLLNAAAPCIIAAFASSARYGGDDTGHRSFRSHIWRTLDPARTGVVGAGGAPLDEYLDFALRAPAMFHPDEGGEYHAFAELAEHGLVNGYDWDEHLSSLFPEVRPRGYFEVRSADAVPPDWLPALVGMIGGITYDQRSAVAALDLLADLPPDALARAGRRGLRDPAIASVARDLARIGLEGCARLGPRFLEPTHLEEMRIIVEERTARGIVPADVAADLAQGSELADASLLAL
jgi:glutamate--cysteine ligase